MSDTDRDVLTVYIRTGCHLCEDLLLQLQELRQMYAFDFVTIDVDSSPQLAQQYGELVPVVMLKDDMICHYFLDQAALLQALGSTNN